MLTVDLCFSLVSLGNNNFGPPVKDKGCFLLSLCFTKRGGDRVVLSFPPKGTLVERGCYQVVCRKGYQGKVYLVVCGFKRVIRPKSLEDMLEDFSLINFLNLLFGYFVTVFSGNNEQSSDRFFQLFRKFFRKGCLTEGQKGRKRSKGSQGPNKRLSGLKWSKGSKS